MLRSKASSLFLLSALFLAGCGGSGTHKTTVIEDGDRVGPRVSLLWPARLRNFTVPSAATVAHIMFPNSGAQSGDLGQYVNRPSGAGATTQNILLNYAVTPGAHLVRIDFLADSSQGNPLATAQMNVRVMTDGSLVNIDGTPIGTVTFDSKVTGLSVSGAQQLEVGETTDLAVVALSENGITALTPGAVTLNVTSGASLVQLNANGSITGVSEGDVQLTPSVDGFTGSSATVKVLPAPLQPLTIPIASNDLVLDAGRDLVWVATPEGAVKGISTTSGAVERTFTVGGNPTLLAISDDGSTLYAGLQTTGAVRKIDLTTNTLGLQFAIPPTGFGGACYAVDLGVQPGHPSTIALSTQEYASSGNNGAEIFDDGVKRTNGLGIYQGTHFVWTATNRLIAWDPFSSDTLRDVAVDANGASTTRAVATGFAGSGAQFTSADGKLYALSGLIIDATTLQRMDAFTFTNINSSFSSGVLGLAVDVPNNRAYFAFNEGGQVWIQSYDTNTHALVGRRRVANTTTASVIGYRQSMVRTSSGLALRLSDKVVLINDLSGL